MRPIIEGGYIIAALGERVLGRVLTRDVVDQQTGEVIVEAGEMLD